MTVFFSTRTLHFLPGCILLRCRYCQISAGMCKNEGKYQKNKVLIIIILLYIYAVALDTMKFR